MVIERMHSGSPTRPRGENFNTEECDTLFVKLVRAVPTTFQDREMLMTYSWMLHLLILPFDELNTVLVSNSPGMPHRFFAIDWFILFNLHSLMLIIPIIKMFYKINHFDYCINN